MGNDIGNLYTRDKKIGEGRTAAVFKCIRKSDWKAFAVKSFSKKKITSEFENKIKLEKEIL